MTRHPSPSARLSQFAARLRQRAKLSPSAVAHYVGVVRRGLAAGDPLAMLRTARSPGAVKIAKAALLHWAEFTDDPRLQRAVQAIAKLPHVDARQGTLTNEQRDRIDAAVRQIEDPVRRGTLLLLVWSGLRVGEILAATPKTLFLWQDGRFRGNPGAAAGASLLLGCPDWPVSATILQQIASTASRGKAERLPANYSAVYATLRRLLRRACEDAGVPDTAPHEFRRLSRAPSGSTRDGSKSGPDDRKGEPT